MDALFEPVTHAVLDHLRGGKAKPAQPQMREAHAALDGESAVIG